MVVPTLTMLAVRHFRGGEPSEVVEPKNPATKFVLAAWNEGEFGDTHLHVAPDVSVYTNGQTLESAQGGPAMIRQTIEYWRGAVPDVTMSLSEEVEQKGHVAMRWRVRGTHTGAVPGVTPTGLPIDLEGAVFMRIEDDKVVEVSTIFDGMLLAMQLGLADAATMPLGQMPGVTSIRPDSAAADSDE